MKRLLFLLLAFTSLSCFAQYKDNYQIELTSKASAYDSEFKILLVKEADKAKVKYFKKKQEPLKLSQQDSLEAETLVKTFRSDQQAQHKLMDMMNKYKSYAVDSLTIAMNHPLLRVSDALSRATDLQTEKHNKNRIVLDGTRVTIKVSREDTPEYVLYAITPRQDTHPLLFQFISEALNLYRGEVENPILQKSDTHGFDE